MGHVTNATGGVTHHISCPGVPSLTLVIFDCDGVLVDSEPISTHVLADALTAAGLPTSPAQAYERYRGKALSDIAADARDRSGSPLPDDFWQRFEHDRARAFERSLRPVDGAAEAVGAVKAAGVAVCVASQGRRSKTEQTLGLTGLRHLFADGTLFSAYDVSRGKPFPDLFLHAATVMNSPPGRTVVVEDTTIGVRAAIAAGMRAIALTDNDDAAAMRELGATPISALSELAPLLFDGAEAPH
jgi:HAD superfamily hydrolase (TIGR01509 family)